VNGVDPVGEFITKATSLLIFVMLLIIGVVSLVVLVYMFLQWWKYRNREEYSLKFVHLLIALPKDNEIKIDAAEQMFAAFHSLKNSGWFSFLKKEDH